MACPQVFRRVLFRCLVSQLLQVLLHGGGLGSHRVHFALEAGKLFRTGLALFQQRRSARFKLSAWSNQHNPTTGTTKEKEGEEMM